MKRISTLFASLMFGIAVMAAPVTAPAKPKSSVTVISADNADILVEIDGRRFDPNDNSIRINGLEEGTHRIKISKERRSGGIFNMNKGQKFDVLYNSMVTIKGRTNLSISIDRQGRVSIQEIRVNNGRGRNTGRDNEWRDREYDFDNGGFGSYDNNYGYESGMRDRDFQGVLESIRNEWLESNKLKSATHIVTTNSLTSAQVKQLVLLFSFESNKLDLAKSAYANTVDKKNYFMLNDAFAFNSSKDDLARFIRNYR